MIKAYPYIERNQWHGSHNYTLYLTDSIQVHLSPDQYDNLKASMSLVAEAEKPLTPEQVDEMLRSVGRTPDGGHDWHYSWETG
jgi:hypothetical protein